MSNCSYSQALNTVKLYLLHQSWVFIESNILLQFFITLTICRPKTFQAKDQMALFLLGIGALRCPYPFLFFVYFVISIPLPCHVEVDADNNNGERDKKYHYHHHPPLRLSPLEASWSAPARQRRLRLQRHCWGRGRAADLGPGVGHAGEEGAPGLLPHQRRCRCQ